MTKTDSASAKAKLDKEEKVSPKAVKKQAKEMTMEELLAAHEDSGSPQYQVHETRTSSATQEGPSQKDCCRHTM